MDRKKILTLFGVAWVSAAFLTYLLWANTVRAKPQDRRTIMAAGRDLPLGATLKKPDLKAIKVLPQDVPRGALFTEGESVGRVALYPLSANEPLTTSKLSTAGGPDGIMATIPAGYRAVAVPVTDVSAVGGLIQPGSRVDVLFTRPGSMAEALTSTILQNVRVMAVGRSILPNQTVDPKAAKVPVATLVVTPEDAQKLELAKNEGKISLSLRNPLDGQNNLDGKPVTTDILDPSASARLARSRQTRRGPNLNDPKVWAQISGEPKPAIVSKKDTAKFAQAEPRAVVDVYRGDKHVQEVFHD